MACAPVKRVVVCADGSWYGPDGLSTRRQGNNSNIYRIYSSVKQGTFVQGRRAVKQVAQYVTAVEPGKRPLDRFNDAVSIGQETCDERVDNIFAFCCQQLNEVTDELWLFGFSCGAYVLRAVADLFHQLSEVHAWDEREYRTRVEKLPYFRQHRQRTQDAISVSSYIVAKAWARQPVIHFMGLLDTIKIGREPSRPQPALLRSTQTLRHALALNETRSSFQPYLFGPLPALSPDLAHRSIIEAWFIGSHSDIGGGSRDDGLSLYPLQWMYFESQAHGLVLEPAWNNHCLTEEPMGLVFPSLPSQDGTEQQPQAVQPWTFQYKNGISVDMVDLRSSHRHGNLQSANRKVLRNLRSRDNGGASSVRSQTYPLTHTLSDQAHKSSWRSKLKLRRKPSTATLASAPVRRDPDVDSLFAPSIQEEPCDFGPRPHAVQISTGPSLFSLFPTSRRQVFDSGNLIGYLTNTPCGTIIHPSVYFICDTYDRLGISGELGPYLDDLNAFRQSNFVKQEIEGIIYMDPWRADFTDLGGPGLKKCRVLVCGRAGAGKSTLINKVFGTVVTQVSSNEHGVHDVDEGFELDTLPGLIIHDSKGFQSGATEEIELLRKFVKKRASAAKPEDRLDAIWFCIDIPSTRVVHEADKKIFEILERYARAIPVVVVRTMKDRFINEHYGAAREQLEDSGLSGHELDARARAQAEAEFRKVQEEDIRQLEQKLGLDKDFAPFVYTSKRDLDSLKELVKRTTMLVPDDAVRANFVSAQIADVDSKVTESIEESMRLLNYSNWSSVVGAMMFTSLVTTPTISHFLCARIIKAFGLADSAKVSEIERIARSFLWKNMGSFVTQSFSQLGVLLAMSVGLTMSTMIGGLPALASLPFASIPPAARLIAKCTCDLVLILCAAFTNKGKFVTKQDFEEAVGQYCANRGGSGGGRVWSIRTRVHREIDVLIPIHTVKVYEPLSVVKMRAEFHRIIATNRFTLNESQRELHTLQAFVDEGGQSTSESTGAEVAVIEDDMRGLDEWMDRRRQREKEKATTTTTTTTGSAKLEADAVAATSYSDRGSSGSGTDQGVNEEVSWIELSRPQADPSRGLVVPLSDIHQAQKHIRTPTTTTTTTHGRHVYWPEMRRSPYPYYNVVKAEQQHQHQQAIFDTHAHHVVQAHNNNYTYRKEGDDLGQQQQLQSYPHIAELPGTSMTDPWNSGILELQGSEVNLSTTTATSTRTRFSRRRAELQ
ncbi:hypothetical protein F5Y17DRAFT_473413 [Xylariaceae sp. FL0594]|nr:hypothetical protein F5Y17DRAFT_473413 [Xylariaceae sp. FL0594]